MKIKDVINIIEKIYPIKGALEDDQEKIGYEVSFDNDLEINEIITTLDVTPKTLEYAIDNKIKLIITHHPLFYNGINEEVRINHQKNEMLKQINHNKITIYAAHTNVDVGEDGLSYRILNKLNLKPVWFLNKETKLGAVVYLEPRMQFGEILELFIKNNDLQHVRYIRLKEKEYTRIAFVAGAGSSLIEDVIDQNVELFITSDIPWHIIVSLQSHNIDCIDVSHSIENEFINIIENLLKFKIKVTKFFVPDLTKVYVQ